MKKIYKIVCICQIYNELCKDNLERFVNKILPVVSDLVVYDDGSTDGSYEYMLKKTPYVLRGTKNDFVNERSHKQLLLQEALKLNPDFILWLDADEVLTANAAEKLQELCAQCEQNHYDAVNMHELNLWRSYSWQRLDSLYDKGWFCRLWRVVPGICFNDTKPGLHQPLFPSTIRNVMWTLDVQVIHYGFSSRQRLAYKYLVYRSHGQRGYDMLDRLISEEKLVVSKVPQELFPEGLWLDDDEPKPLTFTESLAYVEEYRAEVFKPRFSIACLVYKSVEWLKFVYDQVFKYTDMTNKEFFFVANDATSAVLSYLKDNYIPHYVFTNTPEQQQEWYVNNVYRAYNFAASKAQGDFVVFINSDMAFTPGWLDNLWKAYNGENCVTSRLVESGKLRSGQYGVESDFGRDYSSYQEKEFQLYARELTESKLLDGGLFMPLLIRKEHFERVGGYPEGQVVIGSDYNHPVIARFGEACISGDTVLMLKLQTIGIKHQTAFDSLAYHFQWGELDSSQTAEAVIEKIKVAVCNDFVTGSIGEEVERNFHLESLPASVSIDRDVAGAKEDYAGNVRNYIQEHYPEVEVILQNATFINMVDESRYTIAFLQDNIRSMGRPNTQHEENLRRADKLVTDSVQTAQSYPEYDFEIIPGSRDQDARQKWSGLLMDVFKELMIKKANDKRETEQHKVSIIITTFQRTHLLKWGLYSLSLQTIPFEFETIVVNDGLQDETEEICNGFKEKLNLKYLFTGQRNLQGDPVWRVPGFALNIGVKQSSGDILVMCCAEMFHFNQTIAQLTKPILNNPKLLGIPIGKDDRHGALLECINKHGGTFDLEAYNNCVDLDTRMPFLMALHRSQFMEIGGYDEDFIGVAYDDRDFIDRLLRNGCNYCQTDALTVHLYHPRADGYYEGGGPPEWDYNKNVYFSRIGKIVRNEGREWGIFSDEHLDKADHKMD
ncbi:glycosyltransferase [Desulfosporosinus sp. BG]|uniref:glycosyltransferase n=1 Tax=Desulfosporosinus sp. BG TaxID=1633135 RepID=UPI00083A4332|nr:glycosyltransferase [Desulfosporosinus sp. BG]ODA39703.1 Hyaluronan synthase [Desulfosporosinus sp. BG]